MKTKISNELYIASAAPITNKYIYGYDNFEGYVGEFLVHPVIKKSLFGEDIIVGYVEAVSKEEICKIKAIKDPYTLLKEYAVVDSYSDSLDVGCVDWHIKSYTTADKLVGLDVIENYFKRDEQQMIDRISFVRDYCKKYVSNNEIKENVRKFTLSK